MNVLIDRGPLEVLLKRAKREKRNYELLKEMGVVFSDEQELDLNVLEAAIKYVEPFLKPPPPGMLDKNGNCR